MTWFKIDDDFADHPKFVACSDAAVAAWVRALAYSSRFLTDGQVPKAANRLIGTARALRELVSVGLLVDEGDHWQIHDYVDHQRTRAEVEAERNAASERSRRYRSRQRHGVTNASRAYLESESEEKQSHHHLSAVTTEAGPDDELINQAIALVVERRCQGKTLTNPDAYRAKVRATITTDLTAKAADLLTRYQPPADVLAAALEGEKHSLGRYRINDEATA